MNCSYSLSAATGTLCAYLRSFDVYVDIGDIFNGTK